MKNETLSPTLLRSFFKEALRPFDSAACLTGNGDLIALKYETLADIGTLSASAVSVLRYLPLKMGELAILNDPYSGGTVLSHVTLVTPLSDASSSAMGAGLFLAFRIGFRPRLVMTNSLEEEGLRIPPTPLAHNRKINLMII